MPEQGGLDPEAVLHAAQEILGEGHGSLPGQPVELPREPDGSFTREGMGTLPPGRYFISGHWLTAHPEERMAVAQWEEFLGMVYAPAPWARWQITLTVEVLDRLHVAIVAAVAYGADARGNVLGHVVLR